MHHLSDKKLYALCKKYGENALTWRRKFTGLLPEVNRRRLFEKKGFSSIFEFAKKLCGLSEEQVRRVLNLEEKFKDKPILHTALIGGEISVNKLARIASVATPENEGLWAEKVRQLSQSAIETLVRDEKQNGLFKGETNAKSVRAHKAAELDLAPDVVSELLELQRKGIDVNQALREFLQQRKLELAREKEKLAAETDGRMTGHGVEKNARLPSRYIPVQIRRHLQKEFGALCSIAHCRRPARVIHHTQRFALSGQHDPHYLAPLCREHHAIAHAIDAKVQVKRGAG